MAIATHGTASNYLQRAPSPSSLADVVDLILDKGLVIDAYVRVSVIGIELVTIDARIVIASVDTYLRFAEAVNRLDLTRTELAGLPELKLFRYGTIGELEASLPRFWIERGMQHRSPGLVRAVAQFDHLVVTFW